MGRQAPIETTPTADVQIGYWYDFERISAFDLSESDLENKILIWGLTAEGLNNPVSTPVGVMYPSQVQASILQTVLQEVRIQQSYYLEFLSHASSSVSPSRNIGNGLQTSHNLCGDRESSLRRISGGWVSLLVVFISRSFRYFLLI